MTTLAESLKHTDCSVAHMPDGTAVLMNLRNETLLTLNGTAAFMLAGIREGLDEAGVAQRVVARYAVDEATACADVAEFAQKLAAALHAE